MNLARPALTLALLAPLSAAQNPIQDFHQDTKQRLHQLAVDARDQDEASSAAIQALRDAVKTGLLTAPEAHAELAEQLELFLADRAGFMAGFTDGVESDASDSLAAMALFLEPFVVGESVHDATRAAAGKRLAKSAHKHRKRLAVFAKSLQKATKYDLVFDLRHPVLEPMTPSDTATPAAAPARPLRIDLLLGGSDRTVQDDGLLVLGGTANVGGGDVTVAIDLPGQEQHELTVAVDALSGRWSATFGDGTGLPEGNWAVTATQGGVSVSDSLGVQ